MEELELVNPGPVTSFSRCQTAPRVVAWRAPGRIAHDRCYPSLTTFHLLGEMGAVRAHSF